MKNKTNFKYFKDPHELAIELGGLVFLEPNDPILKGRLIDIFEENTAKTICQALFYIEDEDFANYIKEFHYKYLVSENVNNIPYNEKENRKLGGFIEGVKQKLETVLDKRTIKNSYHIGRLFGKLNEYGFNIDKIYSKVIRDASHYHGQLNTNPRFFGWIMGAGLPASTVGNILGTIINFNAGVGNNSIRYIDKQVVSWCKEIFHFPEDSAGVLTSGGSMANLIPLQSAVHHYRHKEGNENKQIRVYVSDQTHGSSAKAVGHIIDLKNVVKISTDNKFRINISDLETQIMEDINNGFAPAILVGSIGTTNTGSIDDLKELIRIKEKYGLWLHVDGAYGGPIIMTKEFEWLNEVFPKFDSFALDFHKLLNITYAVGLSLVRDAETSRRTFGIGGQHYLYNNNENGIQGGPESKDDLSPELTQPSSRALSVYMTFKNLGINGITDMVEKEIEMAKYLEEKIKNNCNDFLEITVPREISIVCFSLKTKPGENIELLNERNLKLMEEINNAGKVAFTSTKLNGKVVLRACICNYQTRENHIDDLIGELIKFGSGKK